MALSLLPLVSAQETALQRHAMATNQVQRIAAGMSARCLDEVQSLHAWERIRGARRQELLEMLGLDPLPDRTPLHAQITGTLDRTRYRIETLVFQSLPGLYVTGNFYVPKGANGPLPTVLYLCGHAPHPLGAKHHYQDRAAWFAAHGFPCLILDTLEFGEVAGIHHGLHDLNMWHWLSLGYTPAGTEVWSAIRALDFLESRPEVDARRIGVTGISGGGSMTWYTSAVDERVAAAAPVCSTFTFGSQAEHWRAFGQCDCIYYHNLYEWDFPVVGALIAPRPLLILSGQRDPDFPPDGYHAVYQRAKRVYEFYSAGDRIRELDADVGHSDPPLFLREARQWMLRWLRGESAPLPAEEDLIPEESADDLACLDSLPKDAINYRIQEQLTHPVTVSAPSTLGAWGTRRHQLIGQLQEKVFRWFPTNDLPFETEILRRDWAWATRYAAYQEVSFQTEPGVRIRAQWLGCKRRSGEVPLVIYAKRAADSFSYIDLDELLPLLGRVDVLIVNPRLSETALSPAEYADVERSAAWVGRTIEAMQVWDLRRTVEWAVTEKKAGAGGITMFGKGTMGILGAYAALFDSRVTEIILAGAPASHWEGPPLLNVLRVTDIPEVLGALAPRRLVSLTRWGGGFEVTRAIYRLEGAQDRMAKAGSLPEAIRIWDDD